MKQRASRDNGGAADAYVTDYMHARYYSPALARFERVDPLRGDAGRPQTLNRYLYTAGNPVNYVDPTGEAAVIFLRRVWGEMPESVHIR